MFNSELFGFNKKKKEAHQPLTGQEFKEGNLPSTDTFDDGLIVGELKMPGSTSTESGGMYMEHKGPNDLVQNPIEERVKAEFEMAPGMNIADEHALEASTDDALGDDADSWLRANDPKYKH